MELTNHNTTLTHKDKILFPKSHITKYHVFEYYKTIADHMIPYLKNRPLTMQRFPEGLRADGFFQKHMPSYFPDWIPTVNVKKVDGWVNQILCNTADTLLYLVNQEVLTFHIALSKIDNIEYPDKLIFDLDPPENNFALVVEAANALRQLLEGELELSTYVMTTGSRGLHVVIPLKSEENFDDIHEFSKMVSNYISHKYPESFTTAIRKDQRKGRLYIDYLRNSYGQTSVAPFSIRAIENAPIATPINWNELENKAFNAQFYNINNIFKRLEKTEDPWKDFDTSSKSIANAKKKLTSLEYEINT